MTKDDARSADRGQEKYHSIFQHSAVSMWEEDISAVRSLLKDLRRTGVQDLREYLGAHRDVVRDAVRSIEVVDANDAAVALFEAEDKRQLLGRMGMNFDTELDTLARASFTEMICAIDEGRTVIDTESTARTLRGKPLPLMAKSYIPLETDPYPNMLVSLIDITKRKTAEAAVSQLQKRIEFILGASKTGLDIVDSQFNLRYVDPEWQKIYGDPAGKTCHEYFMGAKDVCARCVLPTVFLTKKTIVSEEVLVREGNRAIQVTTVPYQDERGEWLAAEINVDITERKRMEAKNRQLAELVESVDDAIVGMNLDRTITVWNTGAERIYGYTAEEMIGQPTSLLIPGDREDEARLIREKLTRGERIEHFETVRRRKDGALIDISLTLSMVRDADGNNAGMASVARDISSQKAIRLRLQRAQRLESLATLAAGIVHQFNNINMAIQGYLDVIQREGNLAGWLATYARGAKQGLERAAVITDRLLALSAPAVAEPKPVRLEALARSILALLEPRFVAEKVTLHLELIESPFVLGDELRLLFVISSLVMNALDSLAEQPVRSVTIRNGRQLDFVFLEVSDTGCGIPPEDLPRLFTPFFTTKGEWASPGSPQAMLKGVGLSLSVSNTTVVEYGGRIEITSDPSKGSTFRLLMPFIKEGAEGAAGP